MKGGKIMHTTYAHFRISSKRYLHRQINPIDRLALYTEETT